MSRSVAISVDGIEPLRRELQAVPSSVRRELSKAIGVVLLRIASEAKSLISRGGRSGITYTRRSVQHTASAAGEAPKTDRGTLVRNITVQMDADGAGGDAGSRDAAAHGRWLELGTSRMAARPWLSVVWAQLQEWAVQRLLEGAGRGFDKGMGK